MQELGPPIAWVTLEEGTPVYDRNGERVGVVERVIADERADIFDGVIVHTHPLPGRHLFADADQIAELHEHGVLLSVDRDVLQEPPEKPGKRSGRDDSVGSALEARLRRAWDWITRRD